MNESLKRFHQLMLDIGISFACYSLPNDSKISTLVSLHPISYQNISDLADNQEEGFVFAPFEITNEHQIWFLRSDKIIDNVKDIQPLKNVFEALPNVQKKGKYLLESTSKTDYARAFDQFKHQLNSKKLKKAVLSKIVIKTRTKEPLISLFARLVKTYPTAFTYLIHLPTGEIWMGASPELLLNQDENGIKTMALAGTQILKNRLLEEVVWENKEKEEQVYVRNYVQKVLASVSKSVSVSNTYSAKAGNLVHLRTDFSINQSFDRSKILEIVKKLHPTPAVCGIPLEESKAIILNIEQHHRAYYTGFLGPIKRDSMSLFVNLRCMQILPENFALYVGGGITFDSEMEKEWEETEAKAQTLLSIINSNEH